ncbi:MAG: type II toxin-antitoxin system RelE/ParE family toxin [Sphingobacteriaceae bacterium]|nr:type II toxin-antitoxin system RelE/ParE family toxin [Sphingobacteriaceae bacterium]
MAKIVWTDQATVEIRDILDYISKDSRRYAISQIRRIQGATKILKSKPLAGRTVPELGDQTIRELIEGNYRIVYRVKDVELIEILTVHHTARDFQSRLFG